VDDDEISNVAVDAAGRIFVAGHVVNGAGHLVRGIERKPQIEYFLRQLASKNLWPLSDAEGIRERERRP
jgi:hypothetical protein